MPNSSPDPIPYVPVAGLRVPATVVPRIIRALRGVYPEITTGKDDEAAVRAVLLYWIDYTVTSHEATLAESEVAVEAAISELFEDRLRRVQEARDRAKAAVSTIQQVPTPPAPTDLSLGDFAGYAPDVF